MPDEFHNIERPKRGGSIIGILLIVIMLQAITVGVLIFLPFGFDHRSSFGLDYDHFVMISALYAFALIGGLVIAAVGRRAGFAAAQLILPILFACVKVSWIEFWRMLGFP